MIRVIRATKKHVRGLEHLFLEIGKFKFDANRINNRDLSLVAVDNGLVVGFMWVGLMANNTVGYVDWYSVMPSYRRKGVGKLLAAKTIPLCQKKKVQYVFGIIKHDEFHSASGGNALQLGGAGIDPVAYTLVRRRLS